MLSDASAADVRLAGTSADDTVEFTLGASIFDDFGLLVQVIGQASGTKDFNGAITDFDNATGNGIAVSGNGAGATTRFDGALTVAPSGAFVPLSLSGPGTVVQSATSSTLRSLSGTTVVVDGGGQNVSLAASLSTTTGRPLTVQNRTGTATTTLSGPIATTGVGINGINVVDNGGGTTTSLTGDVDVTRSSGSALVVSGVTGQTFSMPNTGSTLTAQTGNAVSIGTATAGGGGSGDISIAAALLSSTTGRVASIQQRTGGTLTLSGSLADTATSTGLRVFNNTGGSTVFSGTSKVLTTGSSIGANMASNGGHTVRFTNGGLVLDSTTGNTFSATLGGTVEVSGPGNTLKSIGAGLGALSITSTNISANGVTFQRVDAASAVNGIVATNTGTAGSLAVTGSGGTPGSGGTITGTFGTSRTNQGVAIRLIATHAPSLNRMTLTDSTNSHVNARQVDGLSLTNSVLTKGGEAVNQPTWDDGNVFLLDMAGATTITGNTFDGAANQSVSVLNSSTSPAGTLNFDDNTVECTAPNTSGETSDAVRVENQATTALHVVISDSRLRCAKGGDLFRATGLAGSNLDVDFVRNTLSNTTAQASQAAGSRGASFTSGGTMDINVTGNTVTNARADAIQVTGSSGGSVTGTIAGNTVGTTGVQSSGSLDGGGIDINGSAAPELDLNVTGNEVRQVQSNGIDVSLGNNGGLPMDPDLTFTGNTVAERPATTPFMFRTGILIESGLVGRPARRPHRLRRPPRQPLRGRRPVRRRPRVRRRDQAEPGHHDAAPGLPGARTTPARRRDLPRGPEPHRPCRRRCTASFDTSQGGGSFTDGTCTVPPTPPVVP